MALLGVMFSSFVDALRIVQQEKTEKARIWLQMSNNEAFPRIHGQPVAPQRIHFGR